MDRIKNMQQSLKRYRGQILDKKIGDRLWVIWKRLFRK
jgi:hypothetical protein